MQLEWKHKKLLGYYNERHGKPIDVVTGDLVFCEDHRYNATNLPTKMLPKCTGPWKVLRVTTRSAELKHVHSGIEKPANLRHLRKCRLTPVQVEKLVVWRQGCVSWQFLSLERPTFSN